MGGIVSKNKNNRTSEISRIDVTRSASGEEQTVLYSTTDSKTCTLRAILGTETASVNLMDFTFDREGTRVDINVRLIGSVFATDLTHGGKALDVRKDPWQFRIAYGVPDVRCGFLIVTKHRTAAYGDTLFVTHVHGSTGNGVEQKLIVVVLKVWYDVWKRRFMCKLSGPSRQSSLLDAVAAMKKAYPPIPSNSGNSPTGGGNQTTTTTGVINNTGGPVYGNLNGSIINFCNVFLKYNCEGLYREIDFPIAHSLVFDPRASSLVVDPSASGFVFDPRASS